MLDHLSVLYIRIRESRQAVRMSSSPGSRAPAHCTSVGKVLLVAAPIRDHTGQVTAAISVAAPVQRLSKKTLQTTAPTVMAAADSISRRLGYLPTLAGARMGE